MVAFLLTFFLASIKQVNFRSSCDKTVPLFESVGPPYAYVMPHASKLALPREGRRLSYMALCQKQDKTSAPWIFPFCNIPTITSK